MSLVTIVVITSFPSATEINSWLRDQRVQFWLPFGCAAVGLALYLLKVRFLLAFGATELAFSFASAYLFKDHVIGEGVASWAAGVAVVYLFAKGFEMSGGSVTDMVGKAVFRMLIVIFAHQIVTKGFGKYRRGCT